MKYIKKILSLSFLVIALGFVFGQNVKANGESQKVDVKVVAIIDGDNTEVNLGSAKMNYGANITASFNEVDAESTFAFWIVDGVVDVTLKQNHQFVATNKLEAIAVFSKDKTAYVYLDHSGKYLPDYTKYQNESPEDPELSLDKVGYDHVGWEVVIATDQAVVKKAIYSRTEDDLMPIIDVVGLDENNSYDDIVYYNDVVTLTHEEGFFTHWVDGEGNLISYNIDYSFSALNEFYEFKASSDQVTKESFVKLNELTGYRTNHSTYLAQVELHNGDELVEYGLEVDGELRKASTMHDVTNEFLISTTANWDAVRGYAIVDNNGTYETIFSDYLYKEQGLMIYEIYGAGGNSGAAYTHDYVVLYNGSNQTIDLSAYSLQYGSATENSEFSNINKLSGNVLPKSFYSVMLAGGDNGERIFVDFDLIVEESPINLAASNGKIALVNGIAKIENHNDENVVDFVGFGSAKDFYGEGAAPAPNITKSIQRKEVNGRFLYTKDNLNDFMLLSEIDLSYLPQLIKVTVSFDVDNGDSLNPLVLVKGEELKYDDLPIPNKTGFEFKGWYINSEKTNSYEDSIIDENIIIYAKFDEVLSFITDASIIYDFSSLAGKGSSTFDVATMKTLLDDTQEHKVIVNEASSIYDGNASGGTYEQTAGLLKFGTSSVPGILKFSLESNVLIKYVIVYAETWNASEGNKLNVNGHLLDLTTVQGDSLFYTLDVATNAIEIKTSAKRAFVFKIELYGEDVVKYNVSFDLNYEGATPIETQKVIEGNKAIKPADPIREGYNFLGWKLNGNDFNFSTEITADIELVANWEAKTYYTVTFDAGGGEPEPQVQTVEKNHFATLPEAPEKEGYLFTGWFTEEDELWDFSKDKVTSNITLYAQYEELGDLEEALIYSTGFDASEGFVAATTYDNASAINHGPQNSQWSVIYGTPSTTNAISDGQSLQFRWYTSASTTFGSATTNFKLDNVTKISFKAKRVNGKDMDIVVSYSYDGQDYHDFGRQTIKTSVGNFEFDLYNAIGSIYIRLSIALEGDVTANEPEATTRIVIDELKIYGLIEAIPVEEKLLNAKNNLEIDLDGQNSQEITKNIILPTAGLHETTITWSSSNSNIISATGQVNRPLFEEGNKNITLTAKISIDEENFIEKTFILTVIKQDEISGNLEPIIITLTESEIWDSRNGSYAEGNFEKDFEGMTIKASDSGIYTGNNYGDNKIQVRKNYGWIYNLNIPNGYIIKSVTIKGLTSGKVNIYFSTTSSKPTTNVVSGVTTSNDVSSNNYTYFYIKENNTGSGVITIDSIIIELIPKP